MTTNRLHELEACGQSVWTDVISRQMIRSGTLARYIEDDGVSGVTANPSIFEKAIAGSHDYDDTIRQLGANGCTPAEIYEALAIEDVGTAADFLGPVYDRAQGRDGFVSIEVSPELAGDTAGSIQEARRFWSKLHRPNVMIKVPATQAGIPAIEQLTSEGINVNITLIFAVDVYEQVMEAFLAGLERRVAQGKAIDRVASVASFFVSRVDVLVDQVLEEKVGTVGDAVGQTLKKLEGRAANANAKIAYEHFERVFGSDRFQRLSQHGAQVQRPLWASTSTQNPSYPDTMYVTPLIGPRTVNTMTLETIDAFGHHGEVACDAVRHGRAEAVDLMDDLQAAGISVKAVTDQLTVHGVQKFSAALHGLLAVIDQRRGVLVRA
jgi:transaldolase